MPQRAMAADHQFWVATVAEAGVGAALVASLFAGQTDHQQIKNGDHDACDHDRAKIAALLYGFN